MKNIKNLQNKLISELQKSNLSIREVERRAGLNRNALGNILRGKSKNPTLYTLRGIAEVLKCPLSELVSASEVEPDTEKEPSKAQFILPVIVPLLQETISTVDACFKKIGYDPNLDQFLHCVKEVYSYALGSDDKTIDPKFAQWLVNKYKE